MVENVSAATMDDHAAAASRKRLPLSWLGVVPFFAFALLFLIWPTLDLMIGAFQTPTGEFTLQNIANLNQDSIISAYKISIQVSVASAVLGAVFGFFLAHAAVMGNLPGWMRPTLTTFSGVASNFAGVPLAFAFIATLGAHRPGDDAALQLLRPQPLLDRLQHPQLLGPHHHLSRTSRSR